MDKADRNFVYTIFVILCVSISIIGYIDYIEAKHNADISSLENDLFFMDTRIDNLKSELYVDETRPLSFALGAEQGYGRIKNITLVRYDTNYVTDDKTMQLIPYRTEVILETFMISTYYFGGSNNYYTVRFITNNSYTSSSQLTIIATIEKMVEIETSPYTKEYVPRLYNVTMDFIVPKVMISDINDQYISVIVSLR